MKKERRWLSGGRDRVICHRLKRPVKAPSPFSLFFFLFALICLFPFFFHHSFIYRDGGCVFRVDLCQQTTTPSNCRFQIGWVLGFFLGFFCSFFLLSSPIDLIKSTAFSPALANLNCSNHSCRKLQTCHFQMSVLPPKLE